MLSEGAGQRSRRNPCNCGTTHCRKDMSVRAALLFRRAAFLWGEARQAEPPALMSVGRRGGGQAVAGRPPTATAPLLGSTPRLYKAALG